MTRHTAATAAVAVALAIMYMGCGIKSRGSSSITWADRPLYQSESCSTTCITYAADGESCAQYAEDADEECRRITARPGIGSAEWQRCQAYCLAPLPKGRGCTRYSAKADSSCDQFLTR